MTPAARLLAGIMQLGLDIPGHKQEQLLAYLQLMAKWNRVYNLTALRNPGEWVTYHLLDSLAVLPYVRGPRLLDVGSGAGLPGMVLAMVRPDWQVVSVETVDKKAAFQRQAMAELELGNFYVENCRVEDLRLTSKPDTIVSRAFSSLSEFVELTRHLLKQRGDNTGGQWVAMKGKIPKEEIAGLPTDIHVRQIVELKVPGLHAERCVILMEEN
jgi:16S rRNA (guanine527-N7)-methyltransferase